MRPPGPEDLATPLWQKLAWMAAIWTASVLTLGLVGFIIKLWLR